jgi:hypothetical protein
VVLDLIKESTDFKEDLADGWDEANSSEDEDFDLDVEMEDIEVVQKDYRMSP